MPPQPATPAIACIGVISRNDHPLHVSLFPGPSVRDSVEFQLLLSTSLDIFEARLSTKTSDHDFGLLQAIDEDLAMYGWLTNTGVKFVIIVDMGGDRRDEVEGGEQGDGEDEGRETSKRTPTAAAEMLGLGIRDAEVRPAFRALHRAYIRVLRNPFYRPDERREGMGGIGGMEILSKGFEAEVRRIGETWAPGIAVV